jgi:hypothetical protein
MMATAFVGAGALQQSTSRHQRHNKEANRGRRLHKVKTHLTDGDARLEEVFVLAQRNDDWQQSQWGLPPQGHLP